MKKNQKKTHDHAALDDLYREAESCDQSLFAEMRSNLLLVAGEHYNMRKNTAFNRRVQNAKDLSDQQKLRLTKNHVQRICKTYVNNIISMAPGVGIDPKNESEIQDQKAAELHHAVWKDAKEKYRLDELIDDWGDDYVNIGEVATKIFWDPNSGEIKNYNQSTSEAGVPLYLDVNGSETESPADESGAPHPMAPGQPIYSGEFIFEQIHGFNLLRAPEAKDMRKSPYLIIRKMVALDDLMARYEGDPEKQKFIQAGSDTTMMVFDGAKGGYRKSDKEVLLREFYFRSCPQYPRGFFYFDTTEGILESGELPGGVFPIIHRHFDKIQTTPRGRSPIKVMRPYQAEINRAASKMAEHQITLGDDKLIMRNGGKASSGVTLPGIRTASVTGGEPLVIAGRDGSQYLNYMQAQIAEMYQVLMVAEDSEGNKDGQLDPYAMLFKAASKKKQFQRYVRGFERFLIDICRTYLSLAKIHMPDDAFIYAVGKNEAVNISEFKNSQDLCYEITLEAQSDDIETKMGKQLVLNHLVQYTGAQLGKEDIGKLVRLMPYANMEKGFEDLTLDYDSANNDILALDRGQKPPVHEYDNHIYAVKRATTRLRQPSFSMLPPPVQQNYNRYIQVHQQFQAIIEKKIQAAKDGFIPISGALVACDLYVPPPPGSTPGKLPARARIPYDSLQWLIKRLEDQGQNLDDLDKMNQGAQAQLSDIMASSRSLPPNGMSGQGPSPQPAQGNEPGVPNGNRIPVPAGVR